MKNGNKKATFKGVNGRLKEHGIELVKGTGYFYFIDLEGAQDGYGTEGLLSNLTTTSVMCYRLTDQDEDTWVADGLEYLGEARRNLVRFGL